MHKKIESFLQDVCAEVKYKNAHININEELSGHIYDLIDDYMECGIAEDEAIKKSIEQMGNATEIGKALHKTYKPKIEWALIILISMTLLIGLIALISIARDPAFWAMDVNQFLKSYIVYAGLGTVVFVACFLFDYSRIEKYSLHIYLASLIILFISYGSHNTINGISTFLVGSFRITAVSYILVPLLISYAGLVNRWGNGDLKGVAKLLGLASVSIMLCLVQPSLGRAFLLASGFLVLITRAIISKSFKGNKIAYLTLIYGSGILSTIVMYVRASDYQLARLNVFKYRLDPMGSGYAYYMAQKVKDGARLFGRGEGLYINHSGMKDVFGLPEANTDFILTYIVSAFGWIVGIALIVILGLIIIRMSRASSQIKTDYGRNLTVGIVTVFTLQIIMNILINFGVFPYIAISLPFVSYGGANFVSSMALAGLFLGVYRREDILINNKRAFQN